MLTEKAAVEADVQALKDILAKSAPENTTEAAGSRDQSCEGKTDGERTETVHKDV